MKVAATTGGDRPVKSIIKQVLCVTLVLPAVGAVIGCPNHTQPPPGEVPVPSPLNLLLPRELHISPLIGLYKTDDGDRYLEVRVEARDSFDDATKACGTFRFELYAFRKTNTDPKGDLITTWDMPVRDAKANLVHWDGLTQKYLFNLGWDNPIPEGTPYVLVAIFSSRFSERISDERVVDGK